PVRSADVASHRGPPHQALFLWDDWDSVLALLSQVRSQRPELVVRSSSFALLPSRGWRSSSRGDPLMQINAPAADGDCFAQGPHTPGAFHHWNTEPAQCHYSPGPLAMTGIPEMEGLLLAVIIARLAFFQPRRSPYADQRTGGRRRLLRSEAA